MARMVAAYRAGDAAGCAALWTEDGALFSPFAPPARGRAAIEALHSDWTADGVGSDKRLEVLDAGAEGNLGWCMVAFSEGSATDSGTSLNVLERQPGGDWLIRICSLNSDHAA
jgi:ketosteroid isomerase-like protein